MVRGKGSMRDKKKVSEKAINGCFISSPAKIFKFIRERYIRVHKYLFLYIFFAWKTKALSLERYINIFLEKKEI